MKKYEVALIRETLDLTIDTEKRKVISLKIEFSNSLTSDALDEEMYASGLVESRDGWILKSNPVDFLSERGFELKAIDRYPKMEIGILILSGLLEERHITEYYYQREIDE